MLLDCPKFCITASFDSFRWKIFQKRFEKLDGIQPYVHNGNSLSLVSTELVKQNLGQDRFVVFEDDACPMHKDYISAINNLEINVSWDVLYLGCHLLGGNGKLISSNVLGDIQPYCTHAIVYNKSSYETLLTLKEKHKDKNPHWWDLMICESDLIKIAAFPMLVTQLESIESCDKNLLIHNIMVNSYNVVGKALNK